jgi:hypothetical protein
VAPAPTKPGTTHIGRHPAANVFAAVRFARARARPINTLITLSFTDLGLSEWEASDFFSALRVSFSRRWKREREEKGRPIGTLDDAHAHEHPRGGRRHVHWLLHRPPGLSRAELEREITKRVKKRAGIDDLGTALHFVHDDKLKAPGTLAKYILKGLDPAYGAYYHMRTEAMGWVTGRRTGASRTLGYTARKAFGWDRKTDRVPLLSGA